MSSFSQSFLEDLKSHTSDIADKLLPHSPDGKFIVYQKGNEIMISDEMGVNSRKIGNGSTPYWTK